MLKVIFNDLIRIRTLSFSKHFKDEMVIAPACALKQYCEQISIFI